MTPLKLHQRVWTICVHSDQENMTTMKRLGCILFTIFLFLSSLSLEIASIAFVIEFVSIDMENSLHSIFHLTAFASANYALVNGLFLRKKMTAIFKELVKIHNKSMY